MVGIRVSLIALIFSVLLTAGASGYVFFFSSKLYAASFGVAVMRDAANIEHGEWPLFSASGMEIPESSMIEAYLKSPGFASELDTLTDISRVFRVKNKPILLFASGEESGDVHKLWKRMSRVSRDPISGLMTVEVFSFSGESAQVIGKNAIFLIDEMLKKMDAQVAATQIEAAASALSHSVDRLHEVGLRIDNFRSLRQFYDPRLEVQRQIDEAEALFAEISSKNIEHDFLASGSRPDDPRIADISRQIEILTDHLSLVREELGPGNVKLSSAVRDFEMLSADFTSAKQLYLEARSEYDRALANAERRSLGIFVYSPLVVPQTPTYTRSMKLLLMIFSIAFMTSYIVFGYIFRSKSVNSSGL